MKKQQTTLRGTRHGLAFLATLLLSLGPFRPELSADEKKTPPAESRKREANPVQVLFDGKSLEGWEATKFGGEGDVELEEGTIVLEIGNDLTGVHYTRSLPKWNYEVTLEAMRVDGHDFFCGLTFPVGESPCSLIVGGWGGGLVGLSSIDGRDASENETTSYRDFDKNRWYRIRLRVTETKIEAWIDDEKVVDQSLAGRRISIRPEVEPSRPFGVASWRTKAALRDIRLRSLR